MKRIIFLLSCWCITTLCSAQDTTFYIGTFFFPCGLGSPGVGYDPDWHEHPDTAKHHGFNSIWVNYEESTIGQVFQEAASCSIKVMINSLKDPVTGIILPIIGAGHSNIYECEVDTQDADNNLTAPNYYYVKCPTAVRDTNVEGASDSVSGVYFNAQYIEPGQSQACRVINGVKARYPAYKYEYPCRDTTWFDHDIKEQEIPQCGNTVNFGAQSVFMPYYATFRLMRLSGAQNGTAVVCTLNVEVIDDQADTLLVPYVHINHTDTTHWYSILTLDSLPLNAFVEKTVRFQKDSAIVYDIDGWSMGNQYYERPFTHHAFRYSLSWIGDTKIVVDRICVEDTFGRALRLNDNTIYATLNRMKEKIKQMAGSSITAYGGIYISDEIRAYSYGTYNRINKFFVDSLGGINYSNMVWRNYPYMCEKIGYPPDTNIYKVHSYRYFLNANDDSAYTPNLATHIMPFGINPRDSLHNIGVNTAGVSTEEDYQWIVRQISFQLQSARTLCKSRQRNFINSIQTYGWVQTGDIGGARFPTSEEVKLQIYEALCYGAKGLTYEYWGSDSTANVVVKGLKQYNPDSGGWYCTPQMYAVDTAHLLLKKIGGILKRGTSDIVYGIDSLRNGSEIQYPNGFIKAVKAPGSTLYMDVGLFTDNNEKYFMLVNRRTTNCATVIDTSSISLKFNYPYPFRLKHIIADTAEADTFCNCTYAWGNGKIFPSRDTSYSLTVTLNPGEGRFYKIVPYYQSAIDTTINNYQTVYDELYGVNYVSASNTNITGSSRIKFTTEKTSGYIDLLGGFNVELGSTFTAEAVEHLDIYNYPSFSFPYVNNGVTGGNEKEPKNVEQHIINNIPLQYALSPSYPNPTNRLTSFKYQLPKSSNVKLNIYNISGQVVKQFEMGNQKPGHYTIAWDAAKAASGVYFYKLNAGDYQAIKKLVVVK
ncbi:T9SS type A sorting domain-containing protein [candidate division TA06 bacterium]|nr:T9SS type A sorting domain-containing protein [candidate division TA06 bacterium]